MYKKVQQSEEFPKIGYNKKKKLQNIFLGDYEIIKSESIIFCLYIIILLIFSYLFLYALFPKTYGIIEGIPETINKYEKAENIETKNNNDRFIIVANAEGEPNTIAEIIAQNQIDYIPIISAIIPVYNSEDYLQDCLDTVINQTLKKIEIIFIDGGSTDSSLDILKNYAKKDKRVTILKHENLKSGISRNAGITVAKGKYLSFLDSGDIFELNMYEKMHKKIPKEQSDLIIYQSRTIGMSSGLLNEQNFAKNIKSGQIPNKKSFTPLEISKNIFQICEGWLWDKLFRTDFIFSNKIRFLNISNFNDNQFTYTALSSAKSITIIKKKSYIKKYPHKNSLSLNKFEAPLNILLSFEKIINSLKKKQIYDLMKESFWKWAIRLSIHQLKYLDNISKEYLFNALHEKFNYWDYIDDSLPSSNLHRAIHYIKYQNNFPTINIAYAANKINFKSFLISMTSLLTNSNYENINIILLYNDINELDLFKINELKEIRFFTLHALNVSDDIIKDFPFSNWAIKESWYKFLLVDKFSNIDKILYLDCNTIIRKSLLPLWEIDMKDELIGAVEEMSFSKDKAIKFNLKDNFYFNDGVLLINAKEWRKIELKKKLIEHIKKANNFFYIDNSSLNIITDMKKIILNPEFNFMEIFPADNSCQYDSEYLELYSKADPSILHFTGMNVNMKNKDLFISEFSKYEQALHNILNMHLIIPIVLSSDDKYSPYMHTTMISILENAYKTTYYIFFLLVPSNFPENNKNIILSLNDKYKCSINFIYMEKVFENIIMKISHITYPTYYRLLIGDLLSKDFEKCLYLDVDICVCKDLSELFNIDIKDYYIGGVISPSYYFSEEKQCKRLSLPSMNQYVNAGMLVMNLKKIREDNMTQIFIELTKRNYNSQDQDILNVACYGKILTLPPKYNAQVIKLEENNPKLKEIYEERDIIEAKNEPHIIHYSNKNKPWNYLGIYLENYWWNMAQKTPYINNIFDPGKIYTNVLKNFWYKKKNKVLNLDNPKTFLDKIQWLNLYDSTPIKTKLSDKYLVREWAREKIGEKYLIPVLGTYNKFEEIDFEKLPEKFVIKCSHGRSYNYYVKDKTLLNMTDAKITLDKWLNKNFAFQSGLELQYRDIHPKIIIEAYIDNDMGDLINYEFICFNGKPEFIKVDIKILFMPNRYVFDVNWNLLSSKLSTYDFKFPAPKKPKKLEKLLELVSILSYNFTFVRISFYIINDKIYFSEVKFSFSNEIEDRIPKIYDRKLASLIQLPKLAYNIDTGQYYEIKKLFSFYPYYLILFSLIFKLLYILWNIKEKFILI